MIPDLYDTNVISAGQVQLNIKTDTVKLPKGRYDRVSMGRELTKLLAASNGVYPVDAGNQNYQPNNNLLTRTDSTLGQTLIFRRIGNNMPGTVYPIDNTNAYIYNPAVSTAVGASVFGLSYGNEGSEVFSIDIAHTPIYNPASPGVQNVAIVAVGDVATGTRRYNLLTTATGIALTDMQPRDFWFDLLGFDESVLVPVNKDPNGRQYINLQDFTGRITEGYASVSAFLPTYNRVIVDPAPGTTTYLAVDGQTVGLQGNQIRNVNSGYVLLQVNDLGISPANYLTNKYGVPNVFGIVSTEYVNNDIISGFSDAAVPYTHIGRATTLKEATVRLLNPNTGEEWEDLGENTVIVLVINKAGQMSDGTAVTNLPAKTIVRRIPKK
jgi:hypothetical protein